MKLALCISGVCRQHAAQNIERLQERFPLADLFLSTWDTFPPLSGHAVATFPEPEIHYHPVLDVVEACPCPKFEDYKRLCATDATTYDWLHASTKQIIGHAYLVNSIPAEYDMIVRARYDTVISSVIDFTPLLDRSYEERRAVGFATRNATYDHNELVQITDPTNKDWLCYLPDVIIMHRRDMFDTSYALNLYQDKRLWGGEWGWYQVLSRPYGDNHMSFRGGAKIEKQLQ